MSLRYESGLIKTFFIHYVSSYMKGKDRIIICIFLIKQLFKTGLDTLLNIVTKEKPVQIKMLNSDYLNKRGRLLICCIT